MRPENIFNLGDGYAAVDDEDQIDEIDHQARSLQPKADAFVQPPDDGALMASYSVFVVEPGQICSFHSCRLHGLLLLLLLL